MPASASVTEGELVALTNQALLNTTSGILYKWVNFGKGWRPRWFVLEDGVLSYYKIHGHQKIVVTSEMLKGSRVIGEKATCMISRHSNNGNRQVRCKPSAEIHLKILSIRESRSNDKKFYISSDTKRLKFRAETGKDRTAWIEALKAAKEMLPRISISEIMVPVDDLTASTRKLKQRLIREGASEAAIRESEQIMLSEFSPIHSELLLLKQKQSLLIETLQQSELHAMRNRKQHAQNFPSYPVYA